MLEVLADRAFYETSGGGVTLSGGDPMLQPDFSSELLMACKEDEIHTAIETAGNVPWKSLSKILPMTDLIMMDIKMIDPEKHRMATGVSNELILQNAMRLADSGIPLLLRTPIIPTVNDDPQDISSIAEFIGEMVAVREINGAESGGIEWELLPFHQLAQDKYQGLGLAYKARDLPQLTRDKMQHLETVALDMGAPIRLSSR
jgi:pyruvate formate lyase activating enzyme